MPRGGIGYPGPAFAATCFCAYEKGIDRLSSITASCIYEERESWRDIKVTRGRRYVNRVVVLGFGWSFSVSVFSIIAEERFSPICDFRLRPTRFYQPTPVASGVSVNWFLRISKLFFSQKNIKEKQ